MKAFIVAALLVASVAGQSLDMYKTYNKDLSIGSKKGLTFNQFYPYNYKYGGDYSNMINGDYNVPSTQYFGGDDDMYNVLSYEEITAHPLFREYMAIPLFRQYWSYPMFQRYVCSHYFQRYWTIPAFQQYFMQPTLFYKYIYPIVQLYKYDFTSSSVNAFTGGDYYYNKNAYPVEYYNNGRIPTVCYYKSEYCTVLFQKLYNHLMYNTQTDIPEVNTADVYKYNPYFARMYPNMYNKEVYPTVYNKEMYPTYYNKEMYPTYYNKEVYPTIYNKEMYPTFYNKEMYPTVYNKEFQNFEVPSKTLINDDFVRPFLANTINKAMIGDKIQREQTIVPEQVIKA